MVRALTFASCVAVANSQAAGTLTEEKHPPLDYSECDGNGCTKHSSGVVIDSNWRWTHITGDTKNCYTGNEWDKEICPDVATCSKNCVIEGADEEYTNTYGVKSSGGELSLQFVTEGPYSTNIGSRTYLMDDDGENYKLLKLKNKEFTFTVDDSQLDCGLNGALYFVQMDKDGGKGKYSAAGAKYGTGYCDAQCPHDLKWIHGQANVEDWKPSASDVNAGKGKYGTCCTEIDLWEANKNAMAFTMHSCTKQDFMCSGTECGDNPDHRFDGVCDKNGCDIQNFRLTDLSSKFFGPGSDFQIDSTKPITVTTQFLTDSGTDSGKVTEVKQFYTQNGKTIEHPKYTVNGNQHDTITDDFCKDWVAETKDGTNFIEKGGMAGIDSALEAGVVLVMSLWDDHEANMLWLDSTYPVGSTDKGAARGNCDASSGDPKDVEKKQASATVKFSDIKFGPIGSTTGGAGPSPGPDPDPSGCPGGSLTACIDLCPADIFATCVASCQSRCSSVVV